MWPRASARGVGGVGHPQSLQEVVAMPAAKKSAAKKAPAKKAKVVKKTAAKKKK